jgi:very-short-patch-repair endonuclease
MPDVSHIGSTPLNQYATRPDVAVAELAAKQHGVVAHRQLIELGLSKATIANRVVNRRLIGMHRGVYAVGHRALSPNGFRMAAVLACGPGAVLSHRTAAGVWGLRPDHRTRWEVTVPRSAGRNLASFDAHQHRLDPRDRTELDAIPITTVARTLLDLAEVVPRDQVDRALEQAIRLDLYDGRALDDVVARSPGRRGLKSLRAAITQLRPDRAATRSELERVALELIDRHRLPRPEVNARLAGYEVDLLWRARRVVVELDGHAFHSSPDAFERDRRRDAHLQSLGFRTLRFTWRQLDGESGVVAERLAAVLAAGGGAATVLTWAPERAGGDPAERGARDGTDRAGRDLEPRIRQDCEPWPRPPPRSSPP